MSNADLPNRLHEMFAAIDAKNTAGFLSFLSPDASFRFGSAPPVQGHAAIGAAVGGFFSSIEGSSHRLDKILGDESTLVCEGEVNYRRLDKSEISIPFTDVLETSAGLINNYKIYIDIGPLFATE